jgi:hypothetical protein
VTPIIFLDFDGVLNSNAWVWSHSNDGFDHIDPSRVALVNQLIARSKARVVVSSAWRILHTVEELRGGLAEHGFAGDIIGATDRVGSVRGDQIQRWLTANEHDGPFVILDDSTDMAHLLPSLVRCNADTGITQTEVDRALEVLTDV